MNLGRLHFDKNSEFMLGRTEGCGVTWVLDRNVALAARPRNITDNLDRAGAGGIQTSSQQSGLRIYETTAIPTSAVASFLHTYRCVLEKFLCFLYISKNVNSYI